MLCDLPNKIGTATVFNLALYFMTNLRRTPQHFFVFYLFTFMCTLTISMYFRSIAALSRTLSQVRCFAWNCTNILDSNSE
jgi:ATP-binding cassette subfamily G (WHITE) protein 2 (PDR)